MSEWRRLVRDRLDGAGDPSAGDDALVDEIAQHIEERFADQVARGASVEAARAAAIAELDGHERLADEFARRRRRTAPAIEIDPAPARWFTGLRHDLRDALRTLRHSPGFAVAAIATVALTTGPTIAALGLGDWLLLRSIPEVSAPRRVATVNFGTPTEGGFTVSRPSYQHVADLVAASPSVQAMAGWQPGTAVGVTIGGSDARMALAETVTANFFDVLGVRLVAGRAFRAEEDRGPGGEAVTVISERLARAMFPNANPVGQVVRLNDHPFTVVGVAPAAFPGTQIQGSAELWLPGLATPRIRHSAPETWSVSIDRGPFYAYFARLAPGATFEQADAELRAAALALSRTSPATKKFATVQPMLHPIIGVDPLAVPRIQSLVRALTGAGLVLVLLGAANLANLFVFRAVRRDHETAVRRALGASGGRLARLQLCETLIVAIAGGLLGVALVMGIHAALETFTVSGIGRVNAPVDWRLVLMAMGVSVAVGLLMGFAPARLALRTSTSRVLGHGGRSSSRAGSRSRLVFAATQLALSLTLVVGALFFAATLRHVHGVDAGFDPRGVTVAGFGFDQRGYTSDRTKQFLADVVQKLAALRPQDVLATAEDVPVRGTGTGARVGTPGAARAALLPARAIDVTPAFFTSIGTELISGRTFTETDRVTGYLASAVVISETLARQIYGTADVTGRLLMIGATASAPQHEVPIIGVTRPIRWRNLDADPVPLLFRPPSGGSSHVLVVRSAGPPDRVHADIRTATAALDPSLPVIAPTSLDARIAARLGERRLLAGVSAALATIGFLLAAIGIHALISQTAVERTREFGIRLAIGATRTDIVRIVLRSLVGVMAIGLPAGLAVSLASSRIIESRLYGVTASHPAPYLASVVALVAIAIAAAVVPAARASRANPVEVLRSE